MSGARLARRWGRWHEAGGGREGGSVRRAREGGVAVRGRADEH
jgi:hypothetical protein